MPPFNTIISAIKNSQGLMTIIAERLGISVESVRHHLNRQDEAGIKIRQAYEHETMLTIDKAESNIVNAIAKGDMKASMWYLKKKARDRGYGDQTEVNVTGTIVGLTLNDLNLPIEVKLKVLEALREKKAISQDDDPLALQEPENESTD